MLMVSAYVALSTCRPGGMGVMPIPITAIWAWCDRKGYTDDVADHFERVIRTVDRIKVEAANSGRTDAATGKAADA
jgi:hypothetical protein